MKAIQPIGPLLVAAVICLDARGAARGQSPDVFNMPPGLTSLSLVPVGNAGNPGEPCGGNGYPVAICGGVPYSYSVGKFEVTSGQYVQFLNAVAADDSYGLYSLGMSDPDPYNYIGVIRSGSPGNYAYSVAPDWANRPVAWVSWGDAARFANWLTNGQPTGAQDLTTTEDGSYFLNGATTTAALMAVTRNPDARYVIPTEDEWYKAAYHMNDGPTDHYWDYPTRSNTQPLNYVGNPDPGNNANFYLTGIYTLGPPYWRTPVGAFTNSFSPYGTFDQGGNVDEWTETPLTATTRVNRGGDWSSPAFIMTPDARTAGLPGASSSSSGLRIALVPEPASCLLLALAGLLVCRRMMA